MRRSWLLPVEKKNLVLGYSALRSLTYFSEGIPLLIVNQLQMAWGKRPSPPKEFREAVLREAQSLLDKDSEHIANGDFPLSVLRPELPWRHWPRLMKIFTDGLSIGWRRRQHKNSAFRPASQKWLNDLPDYYQRNFHFQTDGYLSESSADLYDHQVEILFRGVAGAMRRLVLPPLIHRFRANTDTPTPHLLELGSGPGSSTQYVLQTLPEAWVTCVDLSQPYLKKAQERLKGFDRVNFVQGDAAQIAFKDETFDGAFSVFMFHELPFNERKRVFNEAYRVLKPGGVFCVVDSLQKDDISELNWGLEQFPKDYHEPFFRNYTLHPLEALFTKAGFKDIHTDLGLYSKAVWAQKP